MLLHIRVGLALLLVCVVGCSPQPSCTPDIAPNILLIMLDDLGYDDLAINNNSDSPTPNLDRLARQGVRFTRHYADSVCSPSRAALLTGMNPARLGFRPNSRGISPDIDTLADLLTQRGYITHHVGKWHVGDTVEEARPGAQGFASWFGFLNQWYLKGTMKNAQIEYDIPTYFNPWLVDSETGPRRHTGHLNDILTDHTLNKISELAESTAPWFINLWYFAPHKPITPAKSYRERFPGTPAGRYRALIKQLDDNLQRVLNRLDETDQAHDTLVIVVSDNGGTNNDVNNNHPFFGVKSTLTEGGLRTPLLLRWPGHYPANTVVDQAVAIYDLLPTIAENLGIPLTGALDGRSLNPLIKGEQLPDRALYWEAYAMGRYQYSVLSADGRWRIRNDRRRRGRGKPAALYDLQSDPAGRINVADRSEATVTSMLSQYSQWHRDVHTVRTTLSRTATRVHAITGSDMLRTPGFGGYTLSIAIPRTEANDLNQDQTLIGLQQKHSWSMKVSRKRVLVNFGDVELTGATPDLSRDCSTITVTGNFHPKVSNFKRDRDKFAVDLFINNQKVDSKSANRRLMSDSSVTEATIVEWRIGSGDFGSDSYRILSTAVGLDTLFPIDEIDTELCARSNKPQPSP